MKSYLSFVVFETWRTYSQIDSYDWVVIFAVLFWIGLIYFALLASFIPGVIALLSYPVLLIFGSIGYTAIQHPFNGMVKPHYEFVVFSPYPHDELALLEEGQYIYVIQDISNSGYCKIGKSKNPSTRFKRFHVALPIEIQPVHIIQCDNMAEAESSLHKHFNSKHINGEWYALTETDIAFLKQIKRM